MKTWKSIIRKPIVRGIALAGSGLDRGHCRCAAGTLTVRHRHCRDSRGPQGDQQHSEQRRCFTAQSDQPGRTAGAAVPAEGALFAVGYQQREADGDWFHSLLYQLPSAGHDEYLKCHAAEPTAARTANALRQSRSTSPRSTVLTKMSLPRFRHRRRCHRALHTRSTWGMRRLRTRSRRQSNSMRLPSARWRSHRN